MLDVLHGNCLLSSAVNERRTVKVKILVKQKDKVTKHYTVLRLRLYLIHHYVIKFFSD